MPDYGKIEGRLVMWQAPDAPPIVMQYTRLAEMQVELAKIVNEGGWIEIRRGDRNPAFEEYINAKSVIRYLSEVWT